MFTNKISVMILAAGYGKRLRPITENIPKLIKELNEELNKQSQDFPKMIDSVTRLDRIEAHDGEIYYKYSLLLDDDQKMDYSKINLKKRACSNEVILRIMEEPNLRLINNESKVHFHYTEENSKKIKIFTFEKSDCL